MAVLSAAFAGLVCEIAFNAAREATPPAAYAALCAFLTLLPAALIGLLASPLRRAAVALGLWAGVCGAAIRGPVAAVGFAGVTLAALWREPPSRAAAIRSGIAVAASPVLAAGSAQKKNQAAARSSTWGCTGSIWPFG